ncbi:MULTISPECIES: hypothetical protein [unclassified Bradyrhizobium]|uniref:hypothetical protein n=1 Tax=unclassified Bradyrhizobium TaxID=2631580 RepID=UPI00247AC581|nr:MULTISPECIES: hypothetical protein [unclassified Bradyrhizobium]WGS19320.1 hypothetical protein MTX22_33705 [Bradyrhizobium sp. ISRA463]WGS26155.1 hypothetical protein MTX19_31220 [Bradyrhizobium sp. ISRA464]
MEQRFGHPDGWVEAKYAQELLDCSASSLPDECRSQHRSHQRHGQAQVTYSARQGRFWRCTARNRRDAATIAGLAIAFPSADDHPSAQNEKLESQPKSQH